MVVPPAASGVELWADAEHGRAIQLQTTLKSGVLASRAPADPLLFPERSNATGLARLRLGLDIDLSPGADAALAYEHRARRVSHAAGAQFGGGILPSFSRAPYRLWQLDWPLPGNDGRLTYRHEVDRALVAFHPTWGEITIGRQAIGLGRGVLFGAVDMFAPFSPTEVDREWRRGVDAFRIEYRTGHTSSIELITVMGRGWDDSAALGRIRGYMGQVDGELLFGKRARDALLAGVISATLGDAEVHMELAAFHTTEPQPDGGLFGNDRIVGKATLGGSYTFDVGNGITLLAEYHYSGFGVEDTSHAMRQLRDPRLQERLTRGDMQTLGRHAAAMSLTYPFNLDWSGTLLVLANPVDGSGLASPSVRCSFSDNVSCSLSGFWPWGDQPRNGRIRSEYGAAGKSVFLQLSAYF